MQRGNVFAARTDPVVHFTGALAQNAIATENVRLPMAIAAGSHCRSILRHLVIFSVQNLVWEVALFGRRTFHGAAIAESSFLASWRFSTGSAIQYGGVGPFISQAPNIDLPYMDEDFENRALPLDQQGGHWHVLLVNRSVTAKLAGAAGAVQIVGYLEPTYG